MARNGNGRNGARKRISSDGRTAGRAQKGHGAVIAIGGHEDKEGDKLILRELCRRAGSGRLVVVTVASSEPKEQWEEYEPIFRSLGCRHVHHLHLESREEAMLERT